MNTMKPRVIKDFEKLDIEIQDLIKLAYPDGFSEHLISFTNKEGKRVSVLPYESDTKYYMVRMTVSEAIHIISDDDDYDDDGSLKEEVKESLEVKYAEMPDDFAIEEPDFAD